MLKKILLGTLVVFVVWTALDFLIHGVILMPDYNATSHLWRPMEEMKSGLMHVVGIIVALMFVTIYVKLVAKHDMKTALLYGLFFGIATGISMGYGSYSVMPIPYKMAWVWCFGTILEAVAGAAVMALVVKDGSSTSAASPAPQTPAV